VDLECTAAYEYAKSNGTSFFLYYLYLVLKAVNQTEAFKYRIEEDELYLYDVINGSATIDRDDGTFGFSYIPYFEDLAHFLDRATEEVIEVRMSDQLIRHEIGENIIHFSSVPWLKFSHVSHPRDYKRRDSIPKVTVGKYYMDGKKRKIPVSVHVHHAVADGLHVGKYFDTLQQLFMNP
jgi:chloramphenicol O-acetyltransferase type A